MRKKWLKALLVIVVAVLVVTAAAYQISKSRTFQFFGAIVSRVNTRQKVVALTFDDGPTPGATEEVLSILNEAGVKATFFVIGSELEQNLEEGRKIVAAGHELGNHTYSHKRMVLKTPVVHRVRDRAHGPTDSPGRVSIDDIFQTAVR